MTTHTTEAAVIALPHLNEGELNAGLMFENGKPHHWLILLPGDNDDASQDEQLAFAEKQGGDLPTPSEQSLLRANLPNEFKRDLYWSNKKEGRGSAWYTHFINGYQYWDNENYKFRGRAVRRSLIE